MKERPILFSAPMVRALLNGSKTQTRRAAKGAALQWLVRDKFSPAFVADPSNGLCPYGQPGDRLWVREAWAIDDEDGQRCYRADLGLGGDADDWERNRLEGAPKYRWKPSIHMHRATSRITLEITGVRVERLQDISEADAIAEGVIGKQTADAHYTAREAYCVLWEQINGGGAWYNNPWVWVVEFKRL